MNKIENRDQAFNSLELLGNRLGWYEAGAFYGYFGVPKDFGTTQTKPLALPGLKVPEGYEPGTAYARVYQTNLTKHRPYVAEPVTYSLTRGISIGAERPLAMDTVVIAQLEVSDQVYPSKLTLEALSQWVTRISEVIDQK